MTDLAEHFRLMARNNAWANARLQTACEALSPEEFRAERTSFFPSLSATLNHILGVDRYYIDMLEGRPLADPLDRYYPELGSIAEIRAAQAEEDARLNAFCDALTAADMDRPVATMRPPDGIVEEQLASLLAHLFQHQIHHRGQAHAMLAGTAVKPPQLDEFFIRYDRAPDALAFGAPQ
jgi:uncharacterized damage-inducible protein DinB